ncbi:MAG: Fur family transcriptional regulator [Sulfuricurvum sp.]|uniref:Fur family transcriptional regulator n=1 Tax=Sulfuricurvum sp. TaxID=2025608 RepID=UPI003D0C708F
MTLDEKITQNGFRLTAPRKKILSILGAQHHPISFEEYTLLDPIIDKSTFYRTMQAFEKADIIHGIESDEGKRYYELSETVHPHFICQKCHSITCLESITSPNLGRYQIDSIVYKGKCPLCSDS